FATALPGRRRLAGARLLVHRLGELVGRRLELLERPAELVRGPAFTVLLEHGLGLLHRLLDHQLVFVGALGRVLLDQLARAVEQRVELVAGLDRLLAVLVLFLVLRGVIHRALDVGLGQTAGRLDPDRALGAGRLVLRGDVQDAVGVDVERDLDLRHAARRRRDPGELELAERLVVLRHRALALRDVDLDRRLIVGRGRERLALAGRDRRVARDQHGGDATEGLDRER